MFIGLGLRSFKILLNSENKAVLFLSLFFHKALNMKRSIYLLLLIILLFSCKNSGERSEGYLIKGYITGYFTGKVVLAKYKDNKMISIDSTLMKKSRFKFKEVKIDHPELLYLIIDDGNIVIEFFADKNHMQINADYNKGNMLEVQGSKAHSEYVSFLENNVVFENKQKEIYDQKDIAVSNNDTAMLALLDSMFSATYREQMNFIYSYVNENTNSFVSAFIASRSLADHITLDQLESISNNFSDSVRSSIYYKELTDKIEVRKLTQEGMQAPDFSLPDTTGHLISLSSLQGKFVLLDFSAGWHGPSRSRHSELGDLYEKYASKGFEIFQVGFERNKVEWQNVIAADKIKWICVSDIKGLDSELVNLYGIRSLPRSFLLDRSGVIISKDLSTEELDMLLDRIL
jgi:peroxiredoxin